MRLQGACWNRLPCNENDGLTRYGMNDVRFIGIHGMGGVGKTTLSQVIYDRFSHQFEGSSFIASVRESSGNQGLLLLQKQLLCQILKERELDVWVCESRNQTDS
ncbi:TMV resistance protein N [Morella rubra]|uniref:TMV resistance protein N n=1 Tax=Morella rubra TaxID=262757 RepID=A0A6A1VFQ3_9ROSI|nr:TMV resistance protein N [Morella rubra]